MEILAQASNTVSDPVLIASLAFAGTLIGGFFKVIANQTKANERLSKGIELLAKNSDKNAKAQAKVALAIEKGNREAKERNGHLGEQNEQIAKLVLASEKRVLGVADRNLEATKRIKKQHVEQQVVEHEVVEHKER